MKERIQDAVERSRAGYSELRLRRIWSSTVLVRGREVDSATSTGETGGLARCCSPGTGWGAVGFSGTAHLEGHLLRAHELSLAGASRQPLRLAPIPIRQIESGEIQHNRSSAVTLAADQARRAVADRRGALKI